MPNDIIKEALFVLSNAINNSFNESTIFKILEYGLDIKFINN